MQFSPKDILTEKRVSLIEQLPDHAIFTKLTGWEDINLTPHAHDRHQIIYILSGTLHIETDGKNYFAADRQLVWIPKGNVHRLSSNNRQISLLVCYFRTDKCANDTFSIYRTDEMTVRNLDFISTFRLVNLHNDPAIFAFALSFLEAIPHICQQSAFLTQTVIATDDSRLKPILEYIRLNIEKELTIKKIASDFGLSPRSLSRMFTNSGIRFVHYLNYHRIVKAIEILSDNLQNIEQTAYEVGFNSPNSFSRVFKQITGESPSSYLKKSHPHSH